MSGNLTKSTLLQFIDTTAPMWVYCQESLKFLEVNKATLKRYGYTRNELLSMTIEDIRPNSEVAKLKMALKTVALGGNVDSGAWLHQGKTGETFYMHLHGTAINYSGKNARLVTAFDINEKINALLKNKMLEKDLYHHTQRIENILESITDGFFAVDKTLNFTFVNTHFEKTFDCKKEDVIDQGVWTVFSKKCTSKMLKKFKIAMNNNKKVSFTDYYSPLKSWFNMSAYPSSEGGLSIYFRDITNEKVLQNQISKERYNLSALINNTEDLIWSIDADFNLISANENFLNVMKFGDKKLRKGDYIFSHLVSEQTQRKWKGYYQRALNDETYKVEELSTEFNYQARCYEISFNPIKNEFDEIIGVGCFGRDITKKKKHDLILQKHKQFLNGEENKEASAPAVSLLNIISQFDFENPGSSENHNLLNQLKLTARQLETIMNQTLKTV